MIRRPIRIPLLRVVKRVDVPSRGVVVASLGDLLIDGDQVLVDTFPIVFA